jgi:hypothetical protein
VREADTSPPSVSHSSRKCGSLDVSQPYGPPWLVTARKHVFAATNEEPTMEELLDASFSVQSISYERKVGD